MAATRCGVESLGNRRAAVKGQAGQCALECVGMNTGECSVLGITGQAQLRQTLLDVLLQGVGNLNQCFSVVAEQVQQLDGV